MSTQRLQNALSRIEQALARIETQAALSAHATPGQGSPDPNLAARHEALRERVSASIAELDLLLEGIEK